MWNEKWKTKKRRNFEKAFQREREREYAKNSLSYKTEFMSFIEGQIS